MRQQTEKNKKYCYTCFSHEAAKDEQRQYYCRGVNDILEGEYIFCQSCPLFGGMTYDYHGENIPECWYYDLDRLQGIGLSPREQKERIEGMIQAGLTEEFPEYLSDDERGHQFEIIERAIRFAAKAHKGATRKGSHIPYTVHPMETMMIVAKMTKDNDVIAAAALHDVVEDTPYTIEDIRRHFGDRVAELVECESEDKKRDMPKELSWKIRKQEALAREIQAPVEAKMIMLADKLSNMRASLRDYRQDGINIWNKFNMKDVKEQQWYYRSVAEVLLELKDYEAYQEYIDILDEVFGNES